MATIASLSDRLRSEIADTGKSFVYPFVADGITNRFLLTYSPVDGTGLVVTDNGTDVSAHVTVEETTGYITFDTIPTEGHSMIAAGQYFRYFTDSEIAQFVNDAFLQHTTNHTDSVGRVVNLNNLPLLEEYPIVVYAATLALYTLATDASFDINIFAPDGVTIPRSERFQQLTQMAQERKEQYKELCSQLGIGLYKIDVFTLRRVSKSTNMYVPVFIPQEVDDLSVPIRVYLPHPTYGAVLPPSNVDTYDFTLYQGDSISTPFVLPFNLTGYTVKAQIRQMPGSPTLLGAFEVAYTNRALGEITLSLTSQDSANLPTRGAWDLQVTMDADPTWQGTYVTGMVYVQPQVTQ